MPTERTEYRAIYRMPASFLEPPEVREAGYAERATDYGTDKKAIREANYYLRRAEESLAHIVRWEKRTVTVGEWEVDDTLTPHS